VKILLTGATGFIGSAFLREAFEHGHSIAALVQQERPPPATAEASNQLTWVRGSLAEPPWDEIVAFGPEVCVHSAWISTPGVYLESPENRHFLRWSLDFLRHTIQIGARHVMVLGTCIEYQASDAPLSEDLSPVAPSSEYAKCKHDLHLRLLESFSHGTATLCWARIFYPYGPGENPARLCSTIIHSLLRNQQIIIKTPESTKDYIFIDDLARALHLLVDRTAAGTVNIGTGTGVPIGQIANLIGHIMGKARLITFQEPTAAGTLDYVVAATTKLHSLGWHPEVDLEAGLNRLVEGLTR
jgi:nucleoside-diphosphate-sugar epimerase